MGGQVEHSTADVASIDEVLATTNSVLSQHGHIDILVNNAGVARPTLCDQIDDEEWDWVIDTNLKGAFNWSKAVIGAMKKQRRGVIINIASMAARSAGKIGGAHYTASKAGMMGLTRHLARELAPYGIRVNVVCPGATDTPLQRETGATPEEIAAKGQRIPLGRIGTPEDQANAVAFLVSDEASFITGASLDVNGGAFMA
jgi:NAD(P)-dependent dehydrogenase (short-subunit alcohol dehydrogenase family)